MLGFRSKYRVWMCFSQSCRGSNGVTSEKGPRGLGLSVCTFSTTLSSGGHSKNHMEQTVTHFSRRFFESNQEGVWHSLERYGRFFFLFAVPLSKGDPRTIPIVGDPTAQLLFPRKKAFGRAVAPSSAFFKAQRSASGGLGRSACVKRPR